MVHPTAHSSPGLPSPILSVVVRAPQDPVGTPAPRARSAMERFWQDAPVQLRALAALQQRVDSGRGQPGDREGLVAIARRLCSQLCAAFLVQEDDRADQATDNSEPTAPAD